MKLSSARKIYSWTLGVGIALMLLHLMLRLLGWSQLPPTDEVYANRVGFQVIGFCLTALPYWLLGLIAVLLVEFAVVGRKK